jgi:hypothetical protein
MLPNFTYNMYLLMLPLLYQSQASQAIQIQWTEESYVPPWPAGDPIPSIGKKSTKQGAGQQSRSISSEVLA